MLILVLFSFLLFYLFAVNFSPFSELVISKVDWTSIIDITGRIGLTATPLTSLLVIVSIFIFLNLTLENKSKTILRPLATIFFLLLAILSSDIVLFLISWITTGLIRVIENGQHRTKIFYIGMDSFLMLLALILLSMAPSSVEFASINNSFRNLSTESSNIGLLILFLSLALRLPLFPFFFNYKKNSLSHLSMLPLGIILLIKLDFIFQIPFFADLFLMVGIATSLSALLLALAKVDVLEILSLNMLAMHGLIYASLGHGQISSAVILWAVSSLLLASINNLSLLAMKEGKKSGKKIIFWPMAVFSLSYIGLPGLSNFFPLFDMLWSFWGSGKILLLFLFITINILVQTKLFTILFDFKKLFSSPAIITESINKMVVSSILLGLVSFSFLFYTVPSNLSLNSATKLKKAITPYLNDTISLTKSIQTQNIVMILSATVIILGLILGVFIYIVGAKNNLPLKIKNRLLFLIGPLEFDFFLDDVFSKLSKTKVDGTQKTSPSPAPKYILYGKKILTGLNEIRTKDADSIFIQLFAIVAMGLILALFI